MGSTRLQKALIVVCVPGFALLSCLPLFGAYVRWGHDIAFHMLRIRGLADSIKHLELTGRMQMLWCGGYGYPVGICYNQLFLYPAGFMNRAWFTVDDSYRTMVVLISIMTSGIAYYSYRRIGKSRALGLLGSFLYTFTIYRLNNIHTRADVGEFTAMAFLPLFLLGLYELYLGYPDDEFTPHPVLHLVASVSGLVECHVITCRTLAMYCGIFAILTWRKSFSREIFPQLLKSVLLSILLGLYFLVPLFDYYFNKEITSSANGIWEDIPGSAMTLSQMFAPPTTLEDHGMPFAPNLNSIYLPVFVVCIAAAIVLYVRHRKQLAVTNNQKAGTFLKRRFKSIRMLIVFIALSLYLCSTAFPSLWLSEHAPFLYTVLTGGLQFIWRYLVLATAMMITLIIDIMAAVTESEDAGRSKPLLIACAAILCLSVTFQTVQYMRGYLARPSEPASLDPYVNTFIVSGAEYITPDADLAYMKEHLDISVSDDSVMEAAFLERKGTKATASVTNASPQEQWVEFPISAFKGFHVYTAGNHELPIKKGYSDRIRIAVPASFDDVVKIEFRQPLYWRIADLMSWGTLLLLAGGYLRRNKILHLTDPQSPASSH